MKQQPKKNRYNLNFKDKEQGYPRRVSYAKTILDKAPIIPKPLEYSDIDNAFINFIDNEIELTAEGKKIPTFTLLSSQRFSEYTQTWEHTDEDGNLLMNFKTVNRDNNPSNGEQQGGLWNIPGDRYYTLLSRRVLEDSGREVLEVYSMKQPYAVNMSFRVSFVTNIYENINSFNERINELFKSRQCYIRANGHYIPMILEEVNDETQYGIDDRKFYMQSVVIKVMAYIIHEKDFRIERKPISSTVICEPSKAKKNLPDISLEENEDEDSLEYGTISVSIDIKPWYERASFDIDTDMVVERVDTENVRNYRLSVNNEPTYAEKGFALKDGDNVKIKITKFHQDDMSNIVLMGYNPNRIYKKTDNPKDDFEKTESRHEFVEIL